MILQRHLLSETINKIAIFFLSASGCLLGGGKAHKVAEDYNCAQQEIFSKRAQAVCLRSPNLSW